VPVEVGMADLEVASGSVGRDWAHLVRASRPAVVEALVRRLADLGRL
jgi:hypothetical protein